MLNIANLKNLIYDDEEKAFYLIANKRDGIIGLYLYKFHAQDPKIYEEM